MPEPARIHTMLGRRPTGASDGECTGLRLPACAARFLPYMSFSVASLPAPLRYATSKTPRLRICRDFDFLDGVCDDALGGRGFPSRHWLPYAHSWLLRHL